MVCNNSAINYGPCWINILSVTLLISSLESVSSVKVPHTTDSVYAALDSTQQWNFLGHVYSNVENLRGGFKW